MVGPALTDGAYLAKTANDAKVYLVTWGTRRWIANPTTFNACNFNWSKIRTENTVTSLPEGEPIIVTQPFPSKDCAYFRVPVPAGRTGSGIFLVAGGQLREFHTTLDYERITGKTAGSVPLSTALPSNIPIGSQFVEAGLVQDQDTLAYYIRSHFDYQLISNHATLTTCGFSVPNAQKLLHETDTKRPLLLPINVYRP